MKNDKDINVMNQIHTQWLNEFDSSLKTLVNKIESKQTKEVGGNSICQKTDNPSKGNILPSNGSKVKIYVEDIDQWINATIINYYVVSDVKEESLIYKIFVNYIDVNGNLNSALLKNMKPIIF